MFFGLDMANEAFVLAWAWSDGRWAAELLHRKQLQAVVGKARMK